MDCLSRAKRYLREEPRLGIVSWRAGFLMVVVVYTLAVIPAVEFFLRGTGDFATFMVVLWIGLGMASFILVDWVIAWVRLFYGVAHRRRMLQIVVAETLVLLLVVAWLFGRY